MLLGAPKTWNTEKNDPKSGDMVIQSIPSLGQWFFSTFFLMQYTDLISHSNSRQKWLKFDEAIRKLWALIRCLMIWGRAAPSPRLFGWLSSSHPINASFLTLTVCPAATVCSRGNLTLGGLGCTDHLFNSEGSPSHVDSSNPWITRHSPLVAPGMTNTNIYLQPKHISHPLSWPMLSTIPSDPWFPPTLDSLWHWWDRVLIPPSTE